MAYRVPRFLPIATLFLASLGLTRAQIPQARVITELTEAEQTKFVNETIAAGFPDDRADQMTMLVLNRSALVLPLLEQRVEDELRLQAPSKELIETATEMIAYAGDEQALLEVTKLIAIDGARFGRLVERALDNALDFRNPFMVAYRGLDIGSEATSKRIAEWADTRLGLPKMQRLLAEAMLERYEQIPSEAGWNSDPVVSRLKNGVSVGLRQKLVDFAASSEKKKTLQ